MVIVEASSKLAAFCTFSSIGTSLVAFSLGNTVANLAVPAAEKDNKVPISAKTAPGSVAR